MNKQLQAAIEQLRAELELLKKWRAEGQHVEDLIKGTESLLQFALENQAEEEGGDNE